MRGGVRLVNPKQTSPTGLLRADILYIGCDIRGEQNSAVLEQHFLTATVGILKAANTINTTELSTVARVQGQGRNFGRALHRNAVRLNQNAARSLIENPTSAGPPASNLSAFGKVRWTVLFGST
jgi:hypothetical protein